jgi:spore maturation protein CgeB
VKQRFAFFYHSLVSDWNHGNAHFLRGIALELQERGHQLTIYEPADSWSRQNLVQDHGEEALSAFGSAFPSLKSIRYSLPELNLERALSDVDVVLVHEWNDPALVSAIGQYRSRNHNLRAYFHDTHHRAVSAPHELDRFDLEHYDGVLAYGASLKAAYEKLGWGQQVHVWHEAADIRTFYPRPRTERSGDLVWVGNWGDEERSAELQEFFLQPVKTKGWKAEVYGVRYPDYALEALNSAGIEYCGWLPNFEAPNVFARFGATVHVPRRPYTRQLPGIPTIRPFEALACGIPLVSAPWEDAEGLFRIGQDFLMARNGAEMKELLNNVLHDATLASDLAQHGLETVRARHTCGHRVNELLAICNTAPQSSTPVRSEVLS